MLIIIPLSTVQTPRNFQHLLQSTCNVCRVMKSWRRGQYILYRTRKSGCSLRTYTTERVQELGGIVGIEEKLGDAQLRRHDHIPFREERNNTT